MRIVRFITLRYRGMFYHMLGVWWMLNILWPNSYTGGAFGGILPKSVDLNLLRFTPIIWVLLLLIVYHYMSIQDYVSGNILKIFVVEMSFPLFLILTWLLPSFFLKRYLSKLKPKETTESKRANETKQINRSFKNLAICFLLMIAISIFIALQKPITWIFITACAALIILVGFLVFIYFKKRS